MTVRDRLTALLPWIEPDEGRGSRNGSHGTSKLNGSAYEIFLVISSSILGQCSGKS